MNTAERFRYSSLSVDELERLAYTGDDVAASWLAHYAEEPADDPETERETIRDAAYDDGYRDGAESAIRDTLQDISSMIPTFAGLSAPTYDDLHDVVKAINAYIAENLQ